MAEPEFKESPMLAAVSDEEAFVAQWGAMAERAHACSVGHGFWEEDSNDGQLIALMHSELSEALEALRHGDPPSEKIEGFTNAEEEFADRVIRDMDTCAARGYRVGEAILAKHAYNLKRPYKHGKKF